MHSTGHITLIGAGPGAADLLTLRAVQRLQEADVVFYDRLVDDSVLALIPPRVEQIFSGKHVGAHSWPQEKINAVIVAHALQGRRVVRLKSGDPGVFGRAGEELTAARAAGIAVEIVPGVTAACAAAAALGQSLTERHVADTLVFATGTGCAENPLPDAVRHASPGTTLAIYMGARNAGRITRALMDAGLPADTRVDLAVNVSKPGEAFYRANLRDTASLLKERSISGGLMMLVTWPATATKAITIAAE